MKMSKIPAGVASVVGEIVLEIVEEIGRVEVVAEDLKYDCAAKVIDAIRRRNLTSAKRADGPKVVGDVEDSRSGSKAAIRALNTNQPGGESMQCSAPAVAGSGGGWWPHGRVAQYLAVDARTLKARMQETPEDIERPWLNIGSAKSPQYRWQMDFIDTWWWRINQWRTSRNEEGSTGSAGAARMGSGAAGTALTRLPPVRSREKLNRPSQKGATGSLTEFARSLPTRS